MKALSLQAYNQFELIDLPTPEIGPEDVLIQVKAVGICGSDVHGMDGSTGRRLPPLTMGHEASGIITRVGDAVSGWAYAGLSAIGLGLPAIALAAVPLAGVWMATGLRLGRAQDRMAARTET